MREEYEDLAQAVPEVATARRATSRRHRALRGHRHQPAAPGGIDSDETLDEGDDDVEVYGAVDAMEVGDVLPVLRENGSYVVQTPGGLSTGEQGEPGPVGPEGPTGPQGPQGIQGPQGTTGLTGATGSQGPQGNTGATGSQGPAGTAGAKWYSGAGAPAGGTGVVGDWYLNVTNGDVYEKTGASAWTLRDNLTGPQGIQGIQGIQGTQGPTGSTGSQGPKGDTGAQGIQGPTGLTGSTGAQGIQGPAGTPGEMWFTGAGAPAGGLAGSVVGDWYINSANGDYYEKTAAAAWTLRGSLRGPAGPTGPGGDDPRSTSNPGCPRRPTSARCGSTPTRGYRWPTRPQTYGDLIG